MYKIKFIHLVLILVIIQSCKSLDTKVVVPAQTLPKSYSDPHDTTKVTLMNWKKYFSDSLLVQLIDSALHTNYDLKIALQRIESSRANIVYTKGALFPKVGVDAGAGVNKYGEYTMDGAGNKATEITPGQIVPTSLPDLALGLKASWEIDIWGKLRGQRGAAYSRYLASVDGRNFVLTNLISEIATAYYELLALDNQLTILQQTIVQQQSALDVINLQKEAGRANELAVQQFSLQLLNSMAMEKGIKQNVFVTENRINLLIGRFPQKINRVKEDLFKNVPQTIQTGIPSQLLENRPDVHAAELEVTASKFNLKSARAAFFPSFNISAGLGFRAFDPAYLFMTPASLAYSAIGGLTAPLINMSALKSQFQKAKSSQIQSLYEYQKIILKAYVEVVNELSNIKNLQEIVALKQTQSDLSNQSIDISIELYRSAKAEYIEVLIAQQNALRSNIELVEVSRNLRIATVNIYRQLGGGWQ